MNGGGEAVNELARDLTPHEARQVALKLLTRREHTRAELREKLVARGCAASVAEEVVSRLESERLLSEDRFVESFVAARRSRGYGPVRIREELRQRGVDGDVIGRWLDVNAREWRDDLKAVRRKKFGARMPKSYSERAKQARFLQYRGFTADQIQKILSDRDTD
jgi:regulatory protein